MNRQITPVSPNSWRGKSRREIYRLVLSGELELDCNPLETFLRQIESCYPFGERKGSPYKAWGKEFGLWCAYLRGVGPMPDVTIFD